MTTQLERTRVAVVGAGGIGSYLATLLHDAGHDVTLCVRTPFDRLVVEKGDQTRDVPVTIAITPDGLEPFPWIVIATKAQDTPGTAPWLDALALPGSVVVVAQNGVSHAERAQPLAPEATILPALINITVEPIGRGHVRHSVGNRISVLGSAEGEDFATLIGPSGVEVDVDAAFHTSAWRKYLGNVIANPITALTLRRVEVFRDQRVSDLARAMIDEAVAIGRAEGADFAADEVDRTFDFLRGLPPHNGTSMLFDRLAGRPLEYELITGHLVETGRRHGIPTPANTHVLALIAALDGAIRDGAAQVSSHA